MKAYYMPSPFDFSRADTRKSMSLHIQVWAAEIPETHFGLLHTV